MWRQRQVHMRCAGRRCCGLRFLCFCRRKPILRWKRDPPDITWCFQFEGHLEKLTHRAWTLNPRDAAAYRARRAIRFRAGNLELHPHVLEDVMLRLVSTPVTCNGTACTMRVLRRFLNSVVGFMALSGAISVVSSARLLPKSSIGWAAVSGFLMCKCRSTSLGLRVVRYRAIRCGRMLRSAQEHPHLLGHPDGSHQKIDRTLEECRMITLDAMTQE